MWRKYFKLKGIRPGEVIFPRVGKVDFSRDDLDPQLLLKLWENDCRYLELTEEGEKYFFGLHQEKNEPVKTKHASSQKEYQDEITNSPGPELSAKELVSAIENAKTLKEAKEYYDQGSQYKTVQDAYNQFVETNQYVETKHASSQSQNNTEETDEPGTE